MKRVLVLLMAMVMLVMISRIAEGALALDQTSVAMDYSQNVALTAANGGESARWLSSDEGVARLCTNRSESVEVVGIGAGAATITCLAGEQ